MLIRTAVTAIFLLLSISADAQSLEADFDEDSEVDYVSCRFVGELGIDSSGRLYCKYVSTFLSKVQEFLLPYFEDLSSVSYDNNQLSIDASSSRCEFSVIFVWQSNIGFVHTKTIEHECWR